MLINWAWPQSKKVVQVSWENLDSHNISVDVYDSSKTLIYSGITINQWYYFNKLKTNDFVYFVIKYKYPVGQNITWKTDYSGDQTIVESAADST